MRTPRLDGVIDRRILVNYRIDPAVAARQLPRPFRPKLVDGWAIGGFCMIHLREMRPAGLPAALGRDSENVAHRFAVAWEAGEQSLEGVYVPGRASNSRLGMLLGGRLFPGQLRHARFARREQAGRYTLEARTDDGTLRVAIDGRVAPSLPSDSVFGSLEIASDFFARGSLGYSDARRSGVYEGLELQAHDWRVQALRLTHLASSYFDDPSRFPPDAIQFDSALLMTGIEHAWLAREPLCLPIEARDR